MRHQIVFGKTDDPSRVKSIPIRSREKALKYANRLCSVFLNNTSHPFRSSTTNDGDEQRGEGFFVRIEYDYLPPMGSEQDE